MQRTGRRGLRTCTFPMRMLEMSGKSNRVALTASKMDEFCFAVRGVVRPEPMMFRTAAVSAICACRKCFRGSYLPLPLPYHSKHLSIAECQSADESLRL